MSVLTKALIFAGAGLGSIALLGFSIWRAASVWTPGSAWAAQEGFLPLPLFPVDAAVALAVTSFLLAAMEQMKEVGPHIPELGEYSRRYWLTSLSLGFFWVFMTGLHAIRGMILA